MRGLLTGRTPMVTAYVCGLALGLGLLVAGLEAVRILLFGDLSGTIRLGYVAVGALVGLLFSFVVGYLNGSLLASWATGFVPAASWLGAPLVTGTLRDVAVALVGALGIGVLLGAVGFAIAAEKHRADAASAQLPDPSARSDLLVGLAASVLLGGGLLAVSSLL